MCKVLPIEKPTQDQLKQVTSLLRIKKMNPTVNLSAFRQDDLLRKYSHLVIGYI